MRQAEQEMELQSHTLFQGAMKWHIAEMAEDFTPQVSH